MDDLPVGETRAIDGFVPRERRLRMWHGRLIGESTCPDAIDLTAVALETERVIAIGANLAAIRCRPLNE